MNNYKSEPEESKLEKKQPYVEPKVLATYKKGDLEKIINPHGQVSGGGCGSNPGGGGGGGCGCG